MLSIMTHKLRYAYEIYLIDVLVLTVFVTFMTTSINIFKPNSKRFCVCIGPIMYEKNV